MYFEAEVETRQRVRPHKGYMQLLYTKHELEYCHLACEGEIGSERTKSARLFNQTRQSPRRKHPAGVTFLAWGDKPPSRLCRQGGRANGRNRLVEQTCQRCASTSRGRELTPPPAHTKATCRGLTLCMSEKASSSLLQTMEVASGERTVHLVEQAHSRL